MRLEFAIFENAQLTAENEELRAKYEDVVVQCERLIDENDQLRAHKEYLTEKIDRIVAVYEQCIQEILQDTSVAPDDLTPPA